MSVKPVDELFGAFWGCLSEEAEQWTESDL